MVVKSWLLMGGYGKYVWSAYGITWLVFSWNIISIQLERFFIKENIKEIYESKTEE